MIIDVTNLDKKLLIRSLYDLASPKGMGIVEYSAKEMDGVKVHDISDYDCSIMLTVFEMISQEQHLQEVNEMKEEEEDFDLIDSGVGAKIADYLNGIPLKLDLYRPYGDYNKIYTYSNAYDIRNGLYLFLEALIKNFPLEDFVIIEKEYPNYFEPKKINFKNSHFNKFLNAAIASMYEDMSVHPSIRCLFRNAFVKIAKSL